MINWRKVVEENKTEIKWEMIDLHSSGVYRRPETKHHLALKPDGTTYVWRSEEPFSEPMAVWTGEHLALATFGSWEWRDMFAPSKDIALNFAETQEDKDKLIKAFKTTSDEDVDKMLFREFREIWEEIRDLSIELKRVEFSEIIEDILEKAVKDVEDNQKIIKEILEGDK